MSRVEHDRAIASALASGDRLQALFEALGSKQHPTRGLWASFGMARQTLAGHLGASNLANTRLVNRTLAQLRETALAIVEKQILLAVRAGEKQAGRELALYAELPRVELDDAASDTLVESAMLAVSGGLDALLAQVQAMILTGVEPEVILGSGWDESGGRVGVLRPSVVVAAAVLWIASTAWSAYDRTVQMAVEESGGVGSNSSERWLKQALAAIDSRTTDCCLRVSGQAVPLKGKFKLTGTPRYADEMDGPPFHHRCRTATALVRAEDANDDLTRRMQQAAQAEMAAQAAKDPRPFEFPVDTFTGRM